MQKWMFWLFRMLSQVMSLCKAPAVLHKHSIMTHSTTKKAAIPTFFSQFKEEAWKINRKWKWTKIPWALVSAVFLDERKLAEVR